ncbi:hypothetical protein GGS21DRAFT_523579 [Xylaria nigripes]|nr:hypothetical protein GGS21DRAFT_523579 [Xylaria nigripes]
MSNFTLPIPVFDGTEREDPQQYLDDIIFYSNLSDISGKSELELRDIKMKLLQYLFRRGLGGVAKEWYLQLSPEKRAHWPNLQRSFVRRFPVRVRYRDIVRASCIDTFHRLPNEDLAEYLGRANQLAVCADDTQLANLKIRLYTHIYGKEHPDDKRVWERVTDVLCRQGLMNRFNVMEPFCTYNDVAQALVFCATTGEEEHSFLDRVDLRSQVPAKNVLAEDILLEQNETLLFSLRKTYAELNFATAAFPNQPSWMEPSDYYDRSSQIHNKPLLHAYQTENETTYNHPLVPSQSQQQAAPVATTPRHPALSWSDSDLNMKMLKQENRSLRKEVEELRSKVEGRLKSYPILTKL